MKMYKGIIVTTLSGFLLTGLAACEREGPAEKAGKAIDEAASNVANEASEVTESVEKKMGEQ
jgi:hyperosmotically inducible protein